MTAQITEGRGDLVGALIVRPDDEVFAITSAGGVIRTRASEVRMSGRVTMGVRLMNLAPGDSVVALARNAESAVDEVVADGEVVASDGETVSDAETGPADAAVEPGVTPDNEDSGPEIDE